MIQLSVAQSMSPSPPVSLQRGSCGLLEACRMPKKRLGAIEIPSAAPLKNDGGGVYPAGRREI